MQYVYQNASGERREITQRMSEEHPEAIVFDDAGAWHSCNPLDTGAYLRVYANCAVNGDPVSGRYPYVSHSLPPSLDKRIAPTRTKAGLVVVENRAQDRAIQAATGWGKE